jgi:polysaccharide pyruvyl transferase WcaK-like protein
MKKILVAGASVYGLENISDDAMLYSWVCALKKKIDITVTLMMRHVPSYLETYPIDNFIENLDYQLKSHSQGKRFRGLNLKDPSNHLHKILKEIQESDLLIIGGDPFIEITLAPYRGILPYTELLILLAKFSNTPILLHGIHFGRPPVSEIGKEKMIFCLDNVQAITTRSVTAYKKLTEYLPPEISTKIGILHTDDAYGMIENQPLLNPDPTNEGLDKWVKQSKDNGFRVAVLTIRTLYWIWDENKRTTFIDQVVEFLRILQKKEKIKFIFLPHCTYNKDDYWEDDRSGHKEIMSKLIDDSFVQISERVDIDRVGRIFEQADCAIGNRRHTGIFAAIKGKPFMLFGEPLHVAPIYEDYGIASAVFVDYDSLTANRLYEAFRKIDHYPDLTSLIERGNEKMLEIFNSGISRIVGLLT